MKYNKEKIQENISLINELMLRHTDKEVILLKTSNLYTYNKGIALIDKDTKNKDWYGISNKNCYKTWEEIEAFLEGLCVGKNAKFNEYYER